MGYLNLGRAYVGTTRIDRLVISLALVILSGLANAAEKPRSVFIHAACNGKISSTILSSITEEVRSSQRFHLIHSLDENAPKDVVLTLYINCTERSDVGAVAFAYGQAKCYSSKNCHLVVDGSTIRSALCASNAAKECGRVLFRAFDEYISSPNPVPLELN